MVLRVFFFSLPTLTSPHEMHHVWIATWECSPKCTDFTKVSILSLYGYAPFPEALYTQYENESRQVVLSNSYSSNAHIAGGSISYLKLGSISYMWTRSHQNSHFMYVAKIWVSRTSADWTSIRKRTCMMTPTFRFHHCITGLNHHHQANLSAMLYWEQREGKTGKGGERKRQIFQQTMISEFLWYSLGWPHYQLNHNDYYWTTSNMNSMRLQIKKQPPTCTLYCLFFCSKSVARPKS